MAPPLFKENAMSRVYGSCAGNPKGIPEDKTKCIKEVWPYQ